MNNSIIPKQTIASFVHDAVEIETAVYTLKQMEAECQRQKKKTLDIAKGKVDEAYNHLCDARQNVSIKKSQISKDKERSFTKIDAFDLIWGIIKYFFIWLVPCVIVAVLVISIISLIINGNEEGLDPILAGLGWVVGAAISLIIGIVKGIAYAKDSCNARNHIRYEQNQAIRRTHVAYENAVESEIAAQNGLKIAQQEQEDAKNEVLLIDDQIRAIRNKREQIESNLICFYNYGIIPPDYRYLDCVIMLDQIFRNDLADSMREAIMLYEERVRHGEVIKGLDKICTMLGNLSQGMAAISMRLDDINQNVEQMGTDLYRYNQNLISHENRMFNEIQRNREDTEKLIEETKIGRYATEQLNESIKRINTYSSRF